MNENNPNVGISDSVVDVVDPVDTGVAAQPLPHPSVDPVEPVRTVDAARSAAGGLGAKRVQELVRYGREYEREHQLKPGRQRRNQLIQLGRRYEVEHGLRVAKPRRRRKGDAWTDFLIALARVVKPSHRPAVERLVAALQQSKVVAKAA